MNGVNGRLVTGPNGNTLFLPATGSYWIDSSLQEEGVWGSYWARKRSGYEPPHLNGQPYGQPYAHVMGFNSGHLEWFGDYRCDGLAVRAVRNSLK